jgi:hypothetical protein
VAASYAGGNPVILCDGERLSVEVDNWRIDLADALEVRVELTHRHCLERDIYGFGDYAHGILAPDRNACSLTIQASSLTKVFHDSSDNLRREMAARGLSVMELLKIVDDKVNGRIK